MLDFLNHGPLMDEAGAADGGGAPADTGADSTALTTTGDTSVALSDAEPLDSGDPTETDLTTTEQPALENGRPAKSTSVALQSIAKTHPQLARQIPRDIAVAARLRSEFPGTNPFDAIKTLQRRLKQLGGEEGIQTMQAALKDIEELDALYAKGDPRMLEKMTETPEGQASFVKLAPHTMNKWEQLAPKAFTRYLAGVINGDLIGQRVDMTIQRIAEMTPKEIAGPDGTKIPNPVLAELAKLQAYFTRLAEFEKLQPEAVSAPAADTIDPLAAERTKLAQREARLKAQDWKTTADRSRDELFTEVWKKETKGLKISAVDQEDIIARFGLRLPKALEAIPGFSNDIKELFENDDREGYLRYLKGKYAETIPRMLRVEIQRRYKPANGTPTQRTETTTTAPKAVDPGFKRVTAMPGSNEIDMRLTTREMFKSGKAILKNGSRVQWV